MPVEIKVPSVGESISEGTIAQWLKPEGAYVKAEEPLFELETEKATTQVAAPADGTLHIEVPEGQTVAIGAVVGRLQEGPPPATSPPVPRQEKAKRAESKPAAREIALSPAARQLVADKQIDVKRLVGSGREGLITKEDVVNYLEPVKPAAAVPAAAPAKPKAAAPPPAADGRRENRQRMSAIRQRIAERLVASQQATATLTTFNEADLSNLLALRTRYKERFQQKHGVALGFLSFFVKACVEALRAFSAVNASIDGNEIVYYHYYDLGIAVSTDKGLMVPVLRGADALSFAQIEKGIADLAERARQGSLSVTDLQGGTFTISNGGVFGSLLSTPILNPPQNGILGMHTIQKRPVVVDDQIVIRPMMYLALSYDHRLVDGREAVLFLVRVKECVENPERLLLEV
jgi:2-oxoglutarate dehydrogenase E2 component (dihydrolipoamide succinyltransferase)